MIAKLETPKIEINLKAKKRLTKIDKPIINGTDTSDATLDSNTKLLLGYTAYANGVKYTGSMRNGGDVTFTPSEIEQTGRNGYYNSITISAIQTQTKNATPIKTLQTIRPDRGKYLTQVIINGVTSSIDSNIQPENIKNGTQILGVTGTYLGDSSEYEYYVNLVNTLTNNGTTGKGLFSYAFNSRSTTTTDKTVIEQLDTSNMTDFSYMFQQCTSMGGLDLSGWETAKVTNMQNMFYYCTNMISLVLNNWNTAKVTNMSNMFYYCNRLTSLDLSDFNTSIVTNMQNMFSYCTKLVTITGTIDMYKVTSVTNMFGSTSTNACAKLETVNLYRLNKTGLSLANSPLLTHDSLVYLLNNLITTTSAKTVTLGTTNKAKLTTEEIAVATDKGWTVA